MKHSSTTRNAIFAAAFLSHTPLAAASAAARDNAPNCDCFLASGTDAGYFQNHRFIDFRNISPGAGEDFTQPPPLLGDSDNQGAESVTSSYFNSSTFTNDWFFLNGPTKHNGTITSIDSPRNIFIFKDNDLGSTYLALRAQRLQNFVSNAEIDTNLQTMFYGSFRTRARLVPAITNSTAPQPYVSLDTNSIDGLNSTHPIAPGAVWGFFTYWNETQESDIEVLTSDPITDIRYSNQPDYDAATDSTIPGTSTDVTMPASIDYTDWHEHRVDWYAGVSRWYVDGQFLLEKKVNVPVSPSALLLNLWSDGGSWSQNMSVGAQVVAAHQWIEMAYNVSGGNGGSMCNTGCRVDGVKVQGTPERSFGNGAGVVTRSLFLQLAVMAAAWLWLA